MTAATIRRFALPRLVVERRYTRDDRCPLVPGDVNFDCGWRSAPVPPPPDGHDGHWKLFDTSPDRKSGWRRIRLDWGDA
jgi:hypothetical protein